MSFHHLMTSAVGGIHGIVSRWLTDDAERLALILASEDQGKIVHQSVDGTLWLLRDWTIPTWEEVSLSATITAKPSVVLVGLVDVVSLSGTAVVLDGVTASIVDMRVLLTAQATASQNGIWLVQSGSWTRPPDFATGANAAGAVTFVTEGDTKAATVWSCSTATGSAVIDTNNLAFLQTGGVGGFFNGGESSGIARTLGNNDAYSLGFLTSNVPRLVIGSAGDMTATSGAAAVVPWTTKAAAGQTANLQVWCDSTSAPMSCITNVGWFNIAGGATPFPSAPIFIALAGGNSYLQYAIQNTSAGVSASTDIVATADTGNNTTNYFDLGINSSTYADPAYTGQTALDSYACAYGGHLVVGTATSGKALKLFSGGTLAANLRMSITDTAIVVNTLPIQGVADPTSVQDVATKHYVDALVYPIATSLVSFAPGTRSVIIYTVPSPTGAGRFILTRCVVRLSIAVAGAGSVSFSIGSTSGGVQIIKATTITSATALGVIGGEATSTLGTDMLSTNSYEAVYDYGQNIYANVTVSGSVTDGQVGIYLYGLFLS